MKLIKAFGLAVVAAVAAMAFIGTSSALAVEDDVVLCKKLIEVGQLCPSGELWPAESIILALGEKILFLTSAFNVECQDSLFEARISEPVNRRLPLSFTRFEFGVLPKPNLGEGCTGCKSIHTTLGPGLIEATEKDDFWFKTGAEFEFLSCLGGITCRYETGEFKALIDHKGTHPLHSGANLPRFVLFQVPMVWKAGSVFCPKEAKWDATYVFYLVHWKEVSGLGWPALDLT